MVNSNSMQGRSGESLEACHVVNLQRGRSECAAVQGAGVVFGVCVVWVAGGQAQSQGVLMASCALP